MSRTPILAVMLLSLAASCSKDAPKLPGGSNRSAAEVPGAEKQAESAAKLPSKDNPPPKLLSRGQIEAGWISLFDGQTLFGWQANSDLNWSVKDGVLGADEKGSPGLLLTTFELADYELHCEFRLEKGGNSGIFLRTVPKPNDPANDCYELNICDKHPQGFTTGSLVKRKKTAKAFVGEGEWKAFDVRVEGNRIEAKLGGETVIELDDDSKGLQKTGHIGLQMNGGKIEFRNVRLRPLGTRPIFDGTSLDGWRVVAGSKSEFAADDDGIHVSNGPGFLETENTWADFALQADARTNGKHLNSGIFFRALPGTAEAPSNGYELQIHHTFAGGDRTQPNDYGTGFGTGAVFRRTKVRWVNADDNEWCTLTLIANGPHFSTWVNGYQVIDWTDERETDETPRKGLRTQAGHLSLQGHDATTDLHFKNLRIADLPK